MRTILVCGIGASGTSAVAGCLHKLGCPMGLPGHLDQGEHYEDICFYNAFTQPIDWDGLKRRIADHRQPPVWGWKNTLTIKAIPGILNYLKGPRIVAVHRSMTASIRGRRDGRCPPGVYYTQQQAETWAIEAMAEYMRALRIAQVPILHVGFEDLLAEPAKIVQELAHFAFYDLPSAPQIQDAINHIDKDRVHA